MKGYRKPTGHYIELLNSTPVSNTLDKVALRPSIDYKFAVDWNTSPMDVSVCWTPKTQAELDAEKDIEADLMRNLKKAITAKATIDYAEIPELQTKYNSLVKYLKAIRDKYRDLL